MNFAENDFFAVEDQNRGRRKVDSPRCDLVFVINSLLLALEDAPGGQTRLQAELQPFERSGVLIEASKENRLR